MQAQAARDQVLVFNKMMEERKQVNQNLSEWRTID